MPGKGKGKGKDDGKGPSDKPGKGGKMPGKGKSDLVILSSGSERIAFDRDAVVSVQANQSGVSQLTLEGAAPITVRVDFDEIVAALSKGKGKDKDDDDTNPNGPAAG